jgi:hypothetical protein
MVMAARAMAMAAKATAVGMAAVVATAVARATAAVTGCCRHRLHLLGRHHCWWPNAF